MPDRLTRDDVVDLLTVIAATDGHQRGPADVDLWFGAAQRGAWTLPQVQAAATLVCDSFTGYRIMPGHVAEKIRAERRQPAPAEQVAPAAIAAARAGTLAIDAAAVEPSPQRAAAIRAFVEGQARKKAIPPPRPQSADESLAEALAQHTALARGNQAAAIDACAACDPWGLQLDPETGKPYRPDIVCAHIGATIPTVEEARGA